MSFSVETVRGLSQILRFRKDPLGYIGDAGRRSVDIRCLQFGLRNVFQVNNPELIRDVLITHDWNFEKGRGLKASKPILGNGLLTSEGELHRRQRRLVQPAFHSARLAAYAQTMVECAAAIRETWVPAETYAMDQQMMRLTLQIVGQTLFSADLQKDAEGIGESLKRALGLFRALASPLTQLLAPLRKWAQHRVAQSRQEIELVLRKIIEEHRAHPEKYDDMLSMLMNTQDDNAAGYMSDELLMDESLTLFLAGHETTANALTWTWYMLAEHPEEAALLYAELDAVLAGRLPTLEDMPKLEVTGRIFREVLRLYPPAWIIARTAVTNYRLGEVEVPAGSMLFMSPYATQRDPRYWDAPEEFRPRRWSNDASGRPKFAFYPFGAGTRNCIGEHFAMMEGVLVIATLAQQWRMKLVEGQTVVPWPQLTLRPRESIYFSAEKRVDVSANRSA
jgi:cytochrome P450